MKPVENDNKETKENVDKSMFEASDDEMMENVSGGSRFLCKADSVLKNDNLSDDRNNIPLPRAGARHSPC